MYPIVFNTSSSVHGSKFVRFPEELSGSGCYGSSILRILAGSGYVSHWSNKIFAEEHGKGSNLAVGTQSSCGCFYEENILHDIIVKLHKYFLRAVQLRMQGFEGLYSRYTLYVNYSNALMEILRPLLVSAHHFFFSESLLEKFLRTNRSLKLPRLRKEDNWRSPSFVLLFIYCV